MSEDVARIKWRSRRGLLELDMILLNFVENHYASLSEQEKTTYKQLLSLPDPELLAYFMQQEIPQDSVFAELVSKINKVNKLK